MAEFTVTIEGVEALRRALSDPELVAGPVRDFLQRSAFTVEARAKQAVPVDTGRLRASITTRVEPLRAIVGSNLIYAAFVEFGTRPHMPPVSALQPWARRHGFASPWPLARAIAARGTRAQPYLLPAFNQSRTDIEGFLAQAARKIEEKWGRATP